MPLTLKEQTISTIKKAKNILITFKDIKYGAGYPAGGDTIAAALALYRIIEKNNKTADIVSCNFKAPKNLSFLSNIEKITQEACSIKEAKISIDIKDTGIKNCSHKIDGNCLNIHLTPRAGVLDLKNIKTEEGVPEYDLIVVLGTADLALLGETYTKNKFIFDNVPIINIDHSAQNECFGDINVIDIKSSSTSEVLWHLLDGSSNIDEDVVNCTLAGIISKTKNFRRTNINPKTLEVVGRLINLGGTRAEIVESLYKTKKVETLKLWGRALSRLKQDNKIIWSLLSKNDFVHSGADEESLSDVIHELITNSPNTDVVILLFEDLNNKIKAIIYSERHDIELPALKLKHFGGQVSYLDLTHANLLEAEKEIMREIKASL